MSARKVTAADVVTSYEPLLDGGALEALQARAAAQAELLSALLTLLNGERLCRLVELKNGARRVYERFAWVEVEP